MTSARRDLRLLAVFVVFAACGQEQASTGEAPSIFAEGADQVMLGVEHFLTRDGVRSARVIADTAYTYEDASQIDMRGLRIEFFDESGVEDGVLTSRSGLYHLESGDLTVRGQVVMEGLLGDGEGSRLETDSLLYAADGDRLTTESAWVLSHGDGTVERGVGLVTDSSLESIETRDWSVSTPGVEVPE